MPAGWSGGTVIRQMSTEKPIIPLCAITVERSLKAMATKTENTAAGPVTLLPDSRDKYAPAKLMFYRTSLALYRNMAEEGKISDGTYQKICTILNKKYGLSSGSIFAETA